MQPAHRGRVNGTMGVVLELREILNNPVDAYLKELLDRVDFCPRMVVEYVVNLLGALTMDTEAWGPTDLSPARQIVDQALEDFYHDPVRRLDYHPEFSLRAQDSQALHDYVQAFVYSVLGAIQPYVELLYENAPHQGYTQWLQHRWVGQDLALICEPKK